MAKGFNKATMDDVALELVEADKMAAGTILGAALGVLIQEFFNPEQELKPTLDYRAEFMVKGLSNE